MAMRFLLAAFLSTIAAYSSASTFDGSSSSTGSNAAQPQIGCSISVQALMFSGGSASDESPSSNLSPQQHQHQHQQQQQQQQQYEDNSDDEDDDDDDGHSSMLSNASVSRFRVSSSRFYSDTIEQVPVSRSASRGKALSARGGAVRVGVAGGSAGSGAFRKKDAVMPAAPSASASSASSELAKKLLVSAIVTLIFEGCIGHVLEFFKIVMQTSPLGTSYASVFRDITSQKGFSGLWDGFAPWGIIQAVLKGGVFGLAHAAAIKALVPIAQRGTIPMALALTLAGGIGGGFQGYVLSPTLLLKTRVMTNPVFRESMSLWRTTVLSLKIGADVVQSEGVLALFKGANVFATKRVFDWSTRYYFSDLFESIFTKLKSKRQGELAALSATERSIASFLGGVASTLFTLPLDVLVAKIQDAKKAGVAVSAFQLFQLELKEKGFSGLSDAYLRGFEARLLHVCLTTVVMKTGAPIVYDLLFGDKKKASK